MKAGSNVMTRGVAISLLSLAGLLHISVVAEAASTPATCCKCTMEDPASFMCVNISGTDCTNAMKSAGDSSGTISIKCDPTPVPAGQCKTIADGGICATVGNVGQATAAVGVERAKKEGVRAPFTPTTPKPNIEVPGLAYDVGITESSGYVSLPYIGQYISALYRFLSGAVIVVAALMVVYGGMLYILGGSVQSVKNGKEKIQDALVGLVLFLASYTLLYAINPAVIELKPLNIRVTKYDDEWLARLDGGDVATTPPDSAAAQAAAAQAAAALGAGGNGQVGTAAPAEGEWATDSQGKRLWPAGCDQLQLVSGKSGSYKAVMAAGAGKPKSKEGLAEVLKAIVAASKTGTFYSRGIENHKPIKPFTDPKKVETFYFRWWIIEQMYNVKKWRSEAMLAPENCGTDLPKGTSALAKYFANPKNKPRLIPCLNATLEVYNNTYLKVANCFDIFTNQCSFAWFPLNVVGIGPSKSTKIMTYDGSEALFAAIASGEVAPGSHIITSVHQVTYTGGLGVGFEIFEVGGMGGGGGYTSPSITVRPGFFGEPESKFGGGIKTVTSVKDYFAGKRFENMKFTVYVPQW